MPQGTSLKLAIGSDHAGFALKAELIEMLEAEGLVVVDHGTNGPESVDYPDSAHKVAEDVADHRVDMGIVICGSGNGVNMTANKHQGVRSAIAWNESVAELARAHNDANVLALPARFIDPETAKRIVERFLSTAFEGGRHQRRVQKIPVH